MRVMPKVLSVRSSSNPPDSGLVKLGQPQPESNLSSELNSGWPDTTSTYRPGTWLSQYSF